MTLENARAGFRALVARIGGSVPLRPVDVVLEATGHSPRALSPYLQELDSPVYVVPGQKPQAGLLKTAKREALGRANRLCTQWEKGIQLGDPLQAVRHLAPATAAAAQRRGMVGHRDERISARPQRKNQLLAICDELFPALTQVYKDPNWPSALALPEHCPPPAASVAASLSALTALRIGKHPSEGKRLDLHQLAAQSLGPKDPARRGGLTLEQGQLIKELRLLQEHLEQLEAALTQLGEHCRQGQLLSCLPGSGPIPAAGSSALRGNLAHFSRASHLKASFGGAAAVSASGDSLDRARLAPRGTRRMNRTRYLLVWTAVQTKDSEWAQLDERLVPSKCRYHERPPDLLAVVEGVGGSPGR